MEGSEFALTSALLAALGAVVYFSWSGSPAQAQQAATKASSSTTKPKSSAAGKRGKKRRPNEMSSLIPAPPTDDHDDTSPSDNKSKPTPSSSAPKRTSPPRVVIQRSSEATVPGGFAPLLSASEMESVHSAGSSAAKSTQKKKRKGAKKEQSLVQESEGERMHPGGLMLAPPPPSAPVSNKKTPAAPARLHETSGASEFDSESGWTRVKRSNKDRGGSAHGGTMESNSDAGVTTSVTEEEGSVASASVSAKRDRGKTLTLAEKLPPKPAETKVDDMLDGPKPSIARVLRVPGSSSGAAVQPAQGLTWEDYEDGNDVKGSGAEADEEDSTWDVVSHKRRGGAQTPSTYASDSAAASTRLSTVGSGSGTPSKKQRQNAAKREAERLAKIDAEKDRQAKVQQHRRELEKLRIAEQFKGKSGKNVVSGGMQAQVDMDGKLLWTGYLFADFITYLTKAAATYPLLDAAGIHTQALVEYNLADEPPFNKKIEHD